MYACLRNYKEQNLSVKRAGQLLLQKMVPLPCWWPSVVQLLNINNILVDGKRWLQKHPGTQMAHMLTALLPRLILNIHKSFHTTVHSYPFFV